MAKRTRKTQPRQWLDFLKPRQAEFRKDSLGTGFLSKLYMTRQQRMTLLRWTSYALACLVALLLQDVIMSRIHIFGTTTDLPACMILLITVIEGTSTGSVFVLIASSLYYFSGSAPGPYVVAVLTILGMGATLFRQLYWHRSRSAISLCACLALMLYEVVVFLASVFSGLTLWARAPRFLITGVMSCVVLIFVYPIIHRLGQIGGHTWKE